MCCWFRSEWKDVGLFYFGTKNDCLRLGKQLVKNWNETSKKKQKKKTTGDWRRNENPKERANEPKNLTNMRTEKFFGAHNSITYQNNINLGLFLSLSFALALWSTRWQHKSQRWIKPRQKRKTNKPKSKCLMQLPLPLIFIWCDRMY